METHVERDFLFRTAQRILVRRGDLGQHRADAVLREKFLRPRLLPRSVPRLADSATAVDFPERRPKPVRHLRVEDQRRRELHEDNGKFFAEPRNRTEEIIEEPDVFQSRVVGNQAVHLHREGKIRRYLARPFRAGLGAHLTVKTRVDFHEIEGVRVTLQACGALLHRRQQFAMAAGRLAPSGQSDPDHGGIRRAGAGHASKEKRWLGRESNPRHEDFQSSALPTELPSRGEGGLVAASRRQGKNKPVRPCSGQEQEALQAGRRCDGIPCIGNTGSRSCPSRRSCRSDRGP